MKTLKISPKVIDRVYAILASWAALGQVGSYEKLEAITGIPKRAQGGVLAEVDYISMRLHGCILSVLVIRKDIRIPGMGFFELIRAEEWRTKEQLDSDQFVINETNKVFANYVGVKIKCGMTA